MEYQQHSKVTRVIESHGPCNNYSSFTRTIVNRTVFSGLEDLHETSGAWPDLENLNEGYLFEIDLNLIVSTPVDPYGLRRLTMLTVWGAESRSSHVVIYVIRPYVVVGEFGKLSLVVPCCILFLVIANLSLLSKFMWQTTKDRHTGTRSVSESKGFTIYNWWRERKKCFDGHTLLIYCRNKLYVYLTL